jgi:hypothetical protein
MADEIDGYVKRPVGYMYVDGIYEMFIGVLFLGWALLDPVWIILLAVIAYCSTHVLKKRITYPRTGYVRLQSSGKKAWMGAIAGFAVAFGLVLFLRSAAETPMVLVTSAIWAFLYAYITRLARLEFAWRWIVTLAMIVGPVCVSLLPSESLPAGRLRLGNGLVGLLFLVSGAVTFALYMRRTHPPQEVTE